MCTRCNVAKPVTEFYKLKAGYKSRCKVCCRAESLAYSRGRRSAVDLIAKADRAANPGSKLCRGCGLVKSLTEFHKSSSHHEGGVVPRCKVCRNGTRKAESDAYYDRHRSEIRQRVKESYHADPETYRASARQYREANIEARRASGRAWYAANREKVKANVAAWVAANPEQRAYNAEAYVKRHPERRSETMRRYGAQRRALIALSGPVDVALLRAKVAYWGNACWLCGGAWADIDHVKPLSKGGSHLLANLRPICKSCNSHKHARWPFSTARRVA